MRSTVIEISRKILDGYTRKVPFACGNLYITINLLNGRPFRVFLKLGKVGVCQCALLESIARLASLAIRTQRVVDLSAVCHALTGISCSNGIVGKPSCVHVLAQELRTFLPPETSDGQPSSIPV